MRSIEEVKAELAALEKIEKEKRVALQLATKPLYRFMLIPEIQSYRLKELMDPTCKLYILNGKVLNAEEMRTAGNTPFEGSMSYIYNTLSRSFVIGVGGGSIFLQNPEGWSVLSEFVSMNPQGGDVTFIVNQYRSSNVQSW
jgi:hypothetical protein